MGISISWRLTSNTCTSCMDFTWRQMEDCLPTTMVHSSGLVMPEGLLMQPAAFPKIMNDNFHRYDGHHIHHILDDILIYFWQHFQAQSSCSGSYSPDSMLMDFLPMQTNASSTSLPVNTSDTCCHLKGLHHGPIQSPDHPDWAAYHEKSRIFNLSSASPTSTVTSFMDILKSQFHLHVLPTRVPLGTSLMSDIPPWST